VTGFEDPSGPVNDKAADWAYAPRLWDGDVQQFAGHVGQPSKLGGCLVTEDRLRPSSQHCSPQHGEARWLASE
jgi:hypothetical protein